MRKSRLISLVFVFLLVLSSPVYAWNGAVNTTGVKTYADVHYSDTIVWARDKGISRAFAVVIARSNDAVDMMHLTDKDWHLNRINYVSIPADGYDDTRDYWARNEMALAKRYVDQAADLWVQYQKAKSFRQKLAIRAAIVAAKNAAIVEVGYGLHPLQDKLAHLNAGMNNPDVGLTHGMLEAPMVDVIMPDGSTKSMHLETKSTTGNVTRLYSLYDDLNYDYRNGNWYFLGENSESPDLKKLKDRNARWVATRAATYQYLEEFLRYAKSKGVDYSVGF